MAISPDSKRADVEPAERVDARRPAARLQYHPAARPAGSGRRGNGFFPGGVAIYETTITVPKEWAGDQILVEFEGVYMNATVRLNRHLIRFHPYGYTSFFCDLTPHVRFGADNTLTVTVNNGAMPNSRWYSGSGIYRHVRLHVLPDLHIAPWGIAVTTPTVAATGSIVAVTTTVEDHSGDPATRSARARVRSTLRNAAGQVVASDESDVETAPDNDAGSPPHRVEARALLSVADARLWSVDDPYLYTLETELVADGTTTDRRETRVGIRSISFDRDSGFRLNGVGLKLKGGCVHHDCGLLGSAAYDRAEERKVELLKASGFNAVRTAHNPPSVAFLDACDSLGMVVIDEAFDCWRDGKNPNDYSVAFEANWQEDIDAMVLRDRNHPSIIMWSTGNEIIERDGRSGGYEYARLLADRVRTIDPTRAVTNALCGLWEDPEASGLAANVAAPAADGERDYWAELTERFAEPLDVVGYNYLLHRYEGDAQRFPKRIICGEETFPKDAFDYWEATERLPHVIGDFVWTAIDYLGEAGIGHVWYNGETAFLGDYPWNQAYCGDIDICGFKRPQSYYRDCVWGIAAAPYIAVHDPQFHAKDGVVSRWGWPDVTSSWSWPGFDGKPIVVDVYSRDDEVELVLNGVSLGRSPAGRGNRYTATFETTYAAGDLVAIGYTEGTERSRTVLRTAGPPAAIRLSPDRSTLRAEYGDLCYVTVELVDAAGSVVHCATDPVHFAVSGEGTLAAVGNGNPKSDEPYVGTTRRVHEGRAMVVIRTSGEPGEITIAAICDGVAAAAVTLTAVRAASG
jgi:beta-galactosidase